MKNNVIKITISFTSDVRAKFSLLPCIILWYQAAHGKMQICTLLIVASDAGWWRYPRRRIQFGTLGKRDISPVWCHRFVNPDKTTLAMPARRGVCDFIQFCTSIIFPHRYRRRTRRVYVRESGNQANWSIRSAREINNLAFCVHGVMQTSNVFFPRMYIFFLFSHVVHHACDLFFFLPL